MLAFEHPFHGSSGRGIEPVLERRAGENGARTGQQGIRLIEVTVRVGWSGLYQATAIVTGSDRRSRPAGFARCLREALVKVSWEPRLSHDPRVDRLAAEADCSSRPLTMLENALAGGRLRPGNQGGELR